MVSTRRFLLDFFYGQHLEYIDCTLDVLDPIVDFIYALEFFQRSTLSVKQLMNRLLDVVFLCQFHLFRRFSTASNVW